MKLNSTITLHNGVKIPILGLGVYLSKPGKESYNAVRYAIDEGYRHIDTASLYANESDVGRAVNECGIPREDIFVTTKVWNTDQGYNNTILAFYKSLNKLKFDYIDLYLIHWPETGLRKETWRALLTLYKKGLCRSIGVSNYTIRHIEDILADSPVKPMINQVEFSPYLYQNSLLKYCNRRNIHLEAYTPLIRGRKFKDKNLIKLADKYSKSPAQILIRWSLQVGAIVIPKSVHEDRIKENANVFDFEISEDDMEIMETFNQNYRVAWDPTNVK